MPVILYHVEASPPCRSVRMLAKQIGLDMQLKAVNLQSGEQNKPEFLKMNPQHCVPTLDDNGFYLWESRCIMQYIANKYAPDGTIYPKDPQKRAIVDRFLFFDMGTLYKTQADFLVSHLITYPFTLIYFT
ncbi:glutathione S-transferase 1-like [Limulus polyphemus]|uniref:Glutathione S-transferase 1-like n=1 Tax=Limulus polyphemus TaxID=6850 RepID=A0ABM1BP69_LIMPO|nr:glutathione S-transferase 1-like [Limulus polyphemus]